MKIEELAAGMCVGNSSILQFSVEKVNFEVVEGKNYKGEFFIESTSKIPITGTIYSSSPRMECYNPKFQGERITQKFEFHSEGLMEGDSQKGNFHIVSNHGEYELPFYVSVSRNYVNSSIGKMKSIIDFANLAQNSYEEAVKVFGQPEFLQIFKAQETKERLIYQMLMRKPCTKSQVEEFLIATKKKQRVVFQVEEKHQEFFNIHEDFQHHITLKKDEWGYAAIEMTSDVKWLAPVKKVITSEEFLGSRTLAEYLIIAKKLHSGKNWGKITFHAPFWTEEVEVCIIQNDWNKKRTDLEIHKRQLEIMRAYIDLGTHKIVTGAWAKLTLKKLEELRLLEPNNLWYLLQKAQVFFANKQRQEAEWALDAFPKYEVDKESPLYAYYLYLCTLREPEPVYVNKLTKKIQKIYHKNQENNLLLWILLFTDEELNYSKSRKLEVIVRQLERSKESPVLYLEACRILTKEPFLIHKAGTFERKMLNWMTKHDILTKEIAKQVCQIASSIPNYHPIWYQILSACYEVYTEKEMLQVICSYCMKWNCYGKTYWKWYQLGVEKELRITGLFEAWIMSAEEKQLKKLPRSVVLYFQHNDKLAYPSQTLLYKAMVEHKTSWKSSYQHYLKNMEEFALKQIQQNKIDKNIAVVYQEVLSPEKITPELEEHLANILFVHKIECSDYNALRLVIRQHQLKKEQIISINHGIGYANIYSSSYEILFEDSKGNRFMPKKELSVVPLLESEKFLEHGIACAKEKIPYLIKYFDKKKIWQTYKEEDLPYLQILIESELISEDYREELRPQMIAYYYYNYTGEALDQFLLSLSFDGVKRKTREKIMELLVARKHYKRAYELLLSYGCESISATKLVHVICHHMEEIEPEPDEFLLGLCRSVFLRGKYNERILNYMCEYFHGNLDEMIKLWQAACDFELDTYALEERCILQFLYTGDFSVNVEKIFQSYSEKTGRDLVMLAYFSWMSHQFVTKDAVISDYVFEKIGKYLKGLQELNEVCRLGFLKWCASKKELTKSEIQWAEEILKEQISLGKYFAFYKTLPEKFARKYMYHDKVFLEYRTDLGAKVKISYLPVQSSEYVECEMQHMYGGIFVKEFLVFYGEKIPYYIKEEQNKTWTVTESGQIQNLELCMSAEGSRFDLLNDMMVSRQMKDEVTLLERLETYGKMDGFVKEKFLIL